LTQERKRCGDNTIRGRNENRVLENGEAKQMASSAEPLGSIALYVMI
jgi:hypothetical protein